MKMLYLAFMALAMPLLLSAKKGDNPNLKPYGKIDKNDLLMKDCDFDPGSEAEVLESQEQVKFTYNGDNIQIREDVMVRVRVFTQKGVDRANINIPLYNYDNENKFTSMEGETFNLDPGGNMIITKLDKKQVYSQKLNKYYIKYSFTLPDVKPGSVFEYSYTKMSNFNGDIPTWYFQQDIPVRYSYLDMVVPDIFIYTTQVHRTLPLDLDSSVFVPDAFDMGAGDSYKGNDQMYAMKDIPAFRVEPFMTTLLDYAQHIGFQLSVIRLPTFDEQILTTWDKLADELMKSPWFGGQMDKSLAGTKDFIDLVNNLPDSVQRMHKVYDYVRTNMSWDKDNTYDADNNINTEWEKKSGTSGEINLILLDLLNRAGLTAYPVLASTRDHGKIDEYFPFLDQFNQMVVYVPVGGTNYILDASQKDIPYNLVPTNLLNTDGYVVSESLKSWIMMSDAQLNYQDQVALIATITPDDSIKGKAYIKSFNYSKLDRERDLKVSRDKFNTDYLIPDNSPAHIDQEVITNQDDDSLPLSQTLDFSMPLSSSGDFIYFNFNLFSGLNKNPFIADKRSSDVDFGYPQYYSFTGNFSLPPGYQLQELPKNIMMIMPDTSIIFRRVMATDSKTLNVHFTLNVRKSKYDVEDYPYLQDFYHKLFGALNEQIVLKKSQ